MTTGPTDRDHEAGGSDAAPLVARGDDATDAVDGPLVEDELLVEEVSIDGMCGVY